MLDHRIILCRQFKKYDDNYRVIDLALPVEICECLAYRISEKNLDALSGAVLELVNLNIASDNEIAKTMNISPDLVRMIKKSILHAQGYVNGGYNKTTELGKRYLLDGESSEFQIEKAFGNMFVSMVDGEVLPFFWEGKLPASRFLPTGTYKVLLENETRELVSDYNTWLPKFMKAYKLFARINKYSGTGERDEIEYNPDEFSDVLYEEVDDDGVESEVTSDIANGEVEQKNKRLIKILNTTKSQTYLGMKIIFSKENPETYAVLSPFQDNMTPWFNKRITWFSENNVNISCGEEQAKTLKELLKGVTEEFYIQFPELKTGNFEFWLSQEYPVLKNNTKASSLIPNLKGIYNLKNYYHNDQVDASEVIIKSQRFLETLLNNYIAQSANKRDILDRFQSFGEQGSLKVKEIFGNYGITDCIVLRNNKWKESLLNLNRYRFGSSVADRYFYLTIEAFFSGKTRFGRLLDRGAAELIENLDNLNQTRNKYGAHSDDIVEKAVSKTEFDKFDSVFTKVIRILLNALFEDR